MFLTSETLELRGVVNKATKDNKVYYIINAETEDGTPHQLYCPDASAFSDQFKKGDLINVTFKLHKYNNSERLVVTNVRKHMETVKK